MQRREGSEITQIRYRYSGPKGTEPMHGHYLMSEHGRGGYLIIGADNRGRRGGLGQEVFTLLVLTVERVSRAETLANADRLYGLKWDSRSRKINRAARAV